jgi:RNA polymerase sigma-70 factor (ECF subfamily)
MKLAALNDDLIVRVRRQEEAALRELMRLHNRRLYRIARGILRDDIEAEDAVQEAYVRAFSHLDEFRGDADIGTWLSRIVMNEALGRIRRRQAPGNWSDLEVLEQRTAEIIPFTTSTTRTDPERSMAQRQIQSLLEQAIDELPTDFRLVLIARVVEEMSVEDTARLLDLEPATVKTRLHRARRLLRDAMETRVGPVLKDAFPFEDPRCERIAGTVMSRLQIAGNLSSGATSNSSDAPA